MTAQQLKSKENLALWVGLTLLGIGAFALMSFRKKQPTEPESGVTVSTKLINKL